MANQAVLVGINQYAKQPGLKGCVNDVDDFKNHLGKTCAVSNSDIVVLTDATATKKGIVDALKHLVASLNAGDTGYFHISSHGVRMPTSDPSEPDGLDEVLCPYEFDWTPQTAITDNEVIDIIAGLRLGARLIFTVDTCHSGDLSRLVPPPGTQPRTLPPPEAIRVHIGNRRAVSRGFRAVGAATNVAFVSACLPWQTAADAVFDGRPNGAFSYYFLKGISETPNATLADVVTAIQPALSRYEMTPVVEGASAWTYTTYLQQTRALKHVRTLAQATAVRASAIVFDQSWDANLFGQRVGVGLQIAASNGQLIGYASVRAFGTSLTVPPIQIDGNTSVPISLGYFGARLVISVSSWMFDTQSIRFDLMIDLASDLPFVPRVRVAQVPVWIPMTVFTRDAARPPVTSPADLVALLTLERMQANAVEEPSGGIVGSREPTIVRGYRDPWLQVVAAGVAGWGPNWREDRVIRPFETRPRPDGLRRHSVEIGPQRGSGNVYVVGWLSAQESDFDFILHMGNNFFGGWGDIDWRVIGYNADIQPFPRGPVREPRHDERPSYAVSASSPLVAVRGTNGGPRHHTLGESEGTQGSQS